MKIAYVCADHGVPVFDWKKGCSIHVQEIVRALTKLGHSVDIYATNIGGRATGDLENLHVHQLPKLAKNLNRADREQAQLNNNHAIHAALAKGGPYDLVYERYSLWSSAPMEYAEKHGIPGVLEVNSPLIEEQVEFRGLVHRSAARQTAVRCFSSASAICAVSGAVADYLNAEFNVWKNVLVVPNGVDTTRFAQIRRMRRQQSGCFTVGFVGSLKPWHGVGDLIKAFSNIHRYPPYSRLLIVGDGPERNSIENQIRNLKLTDVVTLTGAVDPDEIPRLLGEMDVGVAPYPKLDHNYFSPMKVFEYMAAGLPVVATSAGQLTQIIKDECNGLLCPPGDVSALTEALFCLLRDPAMRIRLGRAARRRISDKHTWQSVASRTLAYSSKVHQSHDEHRHVAP